MFLQFVEDMKYYIGMKENKNADGSINWNFIDADMYGGWSVVLDGETYTEWFNKVADEIEGVEA